MSNVGYNTKALFPLLDFDFSKVEVLISTDTYVVMTVITEIR
jgi:hypothetical protein